MSVCLSVHPHIHTNSHFLGVISCLWFLGGCVCDFFFFWGGGGGVGLGFVCWNYMCVGIILLFVQDSLTHSHNFFRVVEEV